MSIHSLVLCSLVITAWVLVNLPLMRVLLIYRKRLYCPIIGHAPNQFLFLAVIFPFAVVAIIHGWHLLINLRETLADASFILDYWFIFFLLAAGLSIVLAISDYTQTMPDFDQLVYGHASNAIEASHLIHSHLQSLADKIERSREEGRIKSLGRMMVYGSRNRSGDLQINPRSSVDDQLAEASRYLYVVCTQSEQEKKIFCDAWLRRLNFIEFAVVITFVLILGLGVATLALYGAKYGFSSGLSKPAGFFSIALFMLALFAPCRLYNRQEIREAYGKPIGLEADLLTIVFALILAAFLGGFYFPDDGTPISKALHFLTPTIAVVGYVIAWLRPEKLRDVFGSDAPWGNQFAIAVIIIFSCLLSLGKEAI